MKNTKKIKKRYIISFLIGALLFGSIGVVVATVASSSVEYSTSENNNVATVENALDDLYNKANVAVSNIPIVCYNGTCGKLSYRYWNNNFAGSTGANSFDSTHMPSTTYATRAQLEHNYGVNNFAISPVYIRSILINSNVVGHQVCLWYNNREFCSSTGYWAGSLCDDSTCYSTEAGTQTKIKLQREMQDALGVTIQDSSCSINTRYVYCDVGDISFYTNTTGRVYTLSLARNTDICSINGNGTASCGY